VSEVPLPVAACRLDLDGLRVQRDRYGEIGRHIDRLVRRSGRLDVWLGAGADPALVAEAIAVEADCCPFFAIAFDPSDRRLTVSVEDSEFDPALDAIQHALTSGSA
jgi:hypothetical protein